MTTKTWTFADTAKALEIAFPWLAVDPESDEWEEPSGADVIDQLQEFYDNLLEGNRDAWTEALDRERQGIQSAAYRQGLALAAAADEERTSDSVAEIVNRLAEKHWDRIASEGAYAAADAMCELAAELLGLDSEALKTRSVAARIDASPEDKEQAVAERLSKAIEQREAYEQALRDVEALTGEIDDLGDYLEYPAADVIAMGEGGAQ